MMLPKKAFIYNFAQLLITKGFNVDSYFENGKMGLFKKENCKMRVTTSRECPLN